MSTKKHLTKAVASAANISQEDSKLAIELIIEAISKQLSNSGRVEVRGFGSFSVRPRKTAGKDESYNTVYFRMSRKLRQEMQSKNLVTN